MDNIEIDGSTLEVLQESNNPLMIDWRIYKRNGEGWVSDGGYIINYYSNYFCFLKNGKPHRGEDKPALIFANGTMIWYKNGERHREGDQPAVIWSDGSKEWYKDGVEIERA